MDKITIISVAFAPRAEDKEIASLIHNPNLLYNDPRFQLLESVDRPGMYKLKILHHRKKRYYTKFYHVSVSNGILLI